MTSGNPFDLTGKAAIVTGASSGLGRHFARTLARAGAKVALAARRVDALAELARQIEAFDERAMPVALDVTDTESVRACVEAAETELGPISILINNAGIAHVDTALDLAEADWDRVMDTNLKGAWLMAQETARHMARLGHGGSIVNVASILGLAATGQLAAYCASKAALINLTRALAVDLARDGIRVNALAPGYVETDLNREFLTSPAGEALKKRIPQRRFGRPEDLDGALLLLASEASCHMTGSVVVVDGGQSAGL
ncbi:MAG: SDR family oxidoreductase [Rhodospirillales bacterium]|nr:SDR family oxidoreductase [Rhodospirillales bacterium]MDH3910224.1 SDR family oxidoreductase [Rhodospirillales bacterium]MDH3918044.1 SDR family oxidoreductase [Rhodospirillales bacterium]MDH3969413.1 SDR family oxidoreductase [Rhodospirillales bacterium]